MGGTNSIGGNGNNFQLTGFLSKRQVENKETKKISNNSPINMTFGNNNIGRKELALLNPYNISLNVDTSGMEKIAKDANELMVKLGFPNYKVTPQQVASVANGLNEVIGPGLKLVEDGAVTAHIANPKGPFADLFT